MNKKENCLDIHITKDTTLNITNEYFNTLLNYNRLRVVTYSFNHPLVIYIIQYLQMYHKDRPHTQIIINQDDFERYFQDIDRVLKTNSCDEIGVICYDVSDFIIEKLQGLPNITIYLIKGCTSLRGLMDVSKTDSNIVVVTKEFVSDYIDKSKADCLYNDINVKLFNTIKPYVKFAAKSFAEVLCDKEALLR